MAGFDRFVQQRLAKQGGADTYAYVFNYKGASSLTDMLARPEDEELNWGVSHGDDMMYMFPIIKLLAPHRIMSPMDLQFSRDFVKIFTDFAAYG